MFYYWNESINYSSDKFFFSSLYCYYYYYFVKILLIILGSSRIYLSRVEKIFQYGWPCEGYCWEIWRWHRTYYPSRRKCCCFIFWCDDAWGLIFIIVFYFLNKLIKFLISSLHIYYHSIDCITIINIRFHYRYYKAKKCPWVMLMSHLRWQYLTDKFFFYYIFLKLLIIVYFQLHCQIGGKKCSFK